MHILGVSCYYHDAAASLIRDGEILAAAQEERFTRKKHDSAFPSNAIQYCLMEATINLDQVDKIVFYDSPGLKRQRLFKTYFSFFPKSIPLMFRSFPKWAFRNLTWKSDLIREFERNFHKTIEPQKVTNTIHHQAHAASAFYPSPYDDAAILVMDGVGEFASTTIWHGHGSSIKLKMEIQFPHSLGLLYSAFTYYTGFKVNSGEYKLMGLAPYGYPKYANLIKTHLIDIDPNGAYRLNMKYFDFATSDQMTNESFHELFGGPPREPETLLTQKEMDIARSIQLVTEEVMLKLANHSKEITGSRNLCLAGGVALNCVGNGKILESSLFDGLWIQPAAGDAGGSLGAALSYWHEVEKRPRTERNGSLDAMKGAFLGPAFDNEEVRQRLSAIGAKYRYYDDEESLIRAVVDLLMNEKVIGWHQGRMEFGPRALGARSIIGDARSDKMQKVMNLKIKYRESFRPFAPSVLRERVHDFFEMAVDSPYMLLVANVKKDRCRTLSAGEEGLWGIEKLNVPRSEIPAVTHVDYSARVQTVHQESNPRYYKLLKLFEEQTGCPVVVNTSFNVRGEPIVCTPEESYRCFMRTSMDALVVENFLLLKSEQPELSEHGDWKKEYQLD